MFYVFATIFMVLVVLSIIRFQYKGESITALAFAQTQNRHLSFPGEGLQPFSRLVPE